MKILLSSIVFGAFLILLGKTSSNVKSLLREVSSLTEENTQLSLKLDEMVESNSRVLRKIGDYKSAMEIGKVSNIALSKNLAYQEKFFADLNMRYDGVLNLNKSLQLDIEKLDAILLSESKKLNDLRTSYFSLTQSNQLMGRENTRLLSLNKLSNQKINQLQSYISDLEDENAIFIKSLNSIKESSARRSKSIPIGVHLNGFKVDEIIDLESNFHAVGYHF
tara:strand:- start:2515 stop:3177 length:663 start_codon:yes stop_codon:yes gene_type:complete